MTTLSWAHVAMHGELKLNMYDRLTVVGSNAPVP